MKVRSDTRCFVCGKRLDKYDAFRLAFEEYGITRSKQFSHNGEHFDLCEKHHRLIIRSLYDAKERRAKRESTDCKSNSV